MKIVSSVILIIVFTSSLAHSSSTHSAAAGLRWQMSDDSGWNAHYERLGIKGRIEDQSLISFVEVINDEYLEDSILEVFVSPEGDVSAKRVKTKSQGTCLYTGQIEDAPTMLDQGWSLKNRTSSVRGSYTCKAKPKSGEWRGTISW